jgi:hypothetical protein
MGVALGWLALAMTGVAAAPPADRERVQITYEVRIVDSEGVGWREAVFTRLKPVARQGAATVWTLPQDAMKPLLTEVGKHAAAKNTQCPKVTAFDGTAATIQCRSKRQFVTQASWKGAGASQADTSEDVRIGWHTTMVGRKLDQGILVKVVFEDTEIRAVHRVKLNEGDKSASSGATCLGGGVAVLRKESCAATEVCCQRVESSPSDHGVRKAVLDVPEISSQEVLGEWLIPSGEVLVVSFGAYTVADANGKAVVKERLALMEARQVPDARLPVVLIPGVPVFGPPSALPTLPALPSNERSAPVAPPAPSPLPLVPGAPIEKLPMPVPAIPSRTIPQGVHVDGRPAELPPLPADETEADSSASESAEPRPSPQTKKPQQAKPPADTAAAKTRYSPPKSATVFLPSLFMPTPSVGFQFLLPLKPLSLRLPFGQRLEIEIYGRVVPDQLPR